MERNEYDASLPDVPPAAAHLFGPAEFGGRLYRRLQDLFRQNAVVTRQIQFPPVMHVSKTDATMTIATATHTKVTHNNIEIDTHGWWDAANYRYIPRETGYYLFGVASIWSDDSTTIPANGYITQLYKNGTVVKRQYATKEFSVATAQFFSSHLTAVMYHDANPNKSGGADYWEHFVFQNSGGNADLIHNGFSTYFYAQFVGGKRPASE